MSVSDLYRVITDEDVLEIRDSNQGTVFYIGLGNNIPVGLMDARVDCLTVKGSIIRIYVTK